MDRSFAGRLGISSPTRPPTGARKGAAAARRPRRGGARAHRQANALDWGLGRLAVLLGAIWRLRSSAWAYVRRRRRLRIAAIVALVATPLLAGGWVWLRGSSLVAVHQVHVSGVSGSDAHQIEAALRSSARGMTTLQVHTAALDAAVAAYPVVRELKVSTHFPHGLSIRVIEQPPVAALTVAGTKTAVAANGVVLGPALASGSLPTLAGGSLPAPGKRLHDPTLLGAVAALGAAPAALAKQVTRAYSSRKGLTLAMRSGLLVYFGDGTRPHAKWLSLARVLADSSSAGASYVDVRLPERPAAGFPGGAVPPLSSGEAGSASSASSGGDSTAAIAERLSEATGTGSPTGAQTGTTSTSGEAESHTEAEPKTTSSGEAGATGSTESGG